MGAIWTFLRQTPCIRREALGGGNLFLAGVDAPEGDYEITANGRSVWSGRLSGGKETVELYLPVPDGEEVWRFLLRGEDGESARELAVKPRRRWEVHLVQFSHHDPGYTDIPSHVLEDSAVLLREALDHLDERADWPNDAKPRIVIEQAYSLYQFLQRSDPADRERMLRHIRAGDVEVTALWANLISEILSPEECLRALYPSHAIEQMTGVPVVTAEHNDITGFTWGYATALCRAGVKYFLPNLPLYYSWGVKDYESFWDEEAVFGRTGPGAFWWESPEGQRIFLWCNNNGCVEETEPSLPTLLEELEQLEDSGWPHTVLRRQVRGEYKDNSRYITGYSDTVRAWNEKFETPRLICSTEKRFCEAFLEKLAVPLPVRRGGVDGQDYPVASTSQMASSVLARETHGVLRSAEILSSIAGSDARQLPSAMEDMLMADEHAYGMGDNASWKHLTSWWEHGCYASRALADAHQIRRSAMTAISAPVCGEKGSWRLTVFRTAGLSGPAAVSAPLDGFDLNLLNGHFRLVEAESGKEVPYLLRRLKWDSPVFLAGARAGVSRGTKRMGLFDPPTAKGYELVFTADDLPACGYAAYEILPCDDGAPVQEAPAEGAIENEYYRVTFGPEGISDVTDKTSGVSLLDPAAPHTLGTLLIRYANDAPMPARLISVQGVSSPVESRVELRYEADGIYSCLVTLTLAAGVDDVSMTARVVKSEAPLQTLYLSFPLAGSGVRYQSVLHETSPAVDTLAGSQSDVLAVQDYVRTLGSDLLWNSANCPVVSLSHLWPGYISPAHRCIMTPPPHPPLKPEAFDTGRIYSILTCNNFGTNFFVSQLSDALYRFTFAARHGRDAALWGAAAMETPSCCLCRAEGGEAPVRADLLSVPGLRVLTLKRAEDKNGLILRLINDGSAAVTAPVRILGRPAALLCECDVLERDLAPLSGDTVTVPAGGLATLRIRF